MRWAWIICLMAPWLVLAQAPSAVLDTSTIRIGEQATLLLSVDLPLADGSPVIDWPAIADTLTGKVEAVHVGEIDTVITEMASEPYLVHYVRKVIITSFDTGFWAIPPFHFTINGQKAETAPLLLQVAGVDLGVDPQLRDIKPIHEVPFDLLAWLRWNWYWIVGILLIGALIFWIAKKLQERQQRPVVVEESGPQLPVHLVFINRLRSLEAEKLWQNGAHKLYHSRLTDLLREYIEQRYRIPALERTTDELLHELRVSPMNADHRERLGNMLRLADMVKFAKALPTPVENEQMMQGAIQFVEGTAPIETIPQHA